MGQHSEAFVGIDTSKLKNAVAIAEAGRDGEVRYLGEFDNTEAAMRKLINKLSAKYAKLTFCYEAGPTGYGLHRQIVGLEHENLVAAPSLIPQKAGDQVKTNRRDAVNLARQLRAGELTAVWVPDPRHEAMRDLSRARHSAVDDLKRKRQEISSLLLRLGLHWPNGKSTWTKAHYRWLAELKLEHREQTYVLGELRLAEQQARERVERIEAQIRAAVPEWSLRDVVAALQAMRGIGLITAVTVMAEIGDLTRFRSAAELMGYLGLVPKEDSTGDKVKRGGITKAGNVRARTAFVEAAWAYQHPPRIGAEKQAKVDAAPEAVRTIAWKAQTRLSKKYRTLIKKGKRPCVAVTAVARELAGFVWAIGQVVPISTGSAS